MERKVTIYNRFLLSLYSDLRATNYFKFLSLIKVSKLYIIHVFYRSSPDCPSQFDPLQFKVAQKVLGDTSSVGKSWKFCGNYVK